MLLFRRGGGGEGGRTKRDRCSGCARECCRSAGKPLGAQPRPGPGETFGRQKAFSRRARQGASSPRGRSPNVELRLLAREAELLDALEGETSGKRPEFHKADRTCGTDFGRKCPHSPEESRAVHSCTPPRLSPRGLHRGMRRDAPTRACAIATLSSSFGGAILATGRCARVPRNAPAQSARAPLSVPSPKKSLWQGGIFTASVASPGGLGFHACGPVCAPDELSRGDVARVERPSLSRFRPAVCFPRRHSEHNPAPFEGTRGPDAGAQEAWKRPY